MLAQFISIEGSEGGGKTTNLEQIKATLGELGIDFVVTREPGGTELAEQLRDLLLTPRKEVVTAQAELLMMFAARAQHVEHFIKPHLAQGTWVISDRFTDATFAYQGGGRQLSWDLIAQLERLAINQFKPDLTLLLDLDPEIGLARAAERGELDRFEQEALPFFQRVRAAYLQRATADPKRFRVVDASQPLNQVQQTIRTHIQQFVEAIEA
ncbi:MAG: dTMP kinase [Gammaproteobacteria bacterium]|nr:dTMP kinase [Gammaproteobacteria bacterium]NVK87765.1 dTMP kinase [Gammaproteobacteria bacterium]